MEVPRGRAGWPSALQRLRSLYTSHQALGPGVVRSPWGGPVIASASLVPHYYLLSEKARPGLTLRLDLGLARAPARSVVSLLLSFQPCILCPPCHVLIPRLRPLILIDNGQFLGLQWRKKLRKTWNIQSLCCGGGENEGAIKGIAALVSMEASLPSFSPVICTRWPLLGQPGWARGSSRGLAPVSRLSAVHFAWATMGHQGSRYPRHGMAMASQPAESCGQSKAGPWRPPTPTV